MALTPYQTSLDGATWIDVNTRITMNSLPDRLPDDASIQYCSFVNLFNCPIGARGPIFQPEYGLDLHMLLQEPIDSITAGRIWTNLINAIRRWEPRVFVDTNNAIVKEMPMLPGYFVRIPITDRVTGKSSVAQFNLEASNG